MKTAPPEITRRNVLKLTLATDLQNLSMVSDHLNRFSDELLAEPEVKYSLDLAVCEALTNVIKHGVDGDPDQQVEIELRALPGRIEVRLWDHGKPIPQSLWTTKSQGRWDTVDANHPDTWPEGGMGLMLIRSVMDEVDYQRLEGQNCLVLVKYL